MAAATVSNWTFSEQIKPAETHCVVPNTDLTQVQNDNAVIAAAFDEMSVRLEAMRKLAQNWDSYGAASPSKHAISLMQRTIFGIAVEHLATIGPHAIPFVVVPTPDGGVQSEWRGKFGGFIEVEIDPEGKFSYLALKNNQSTPEERHDVSDKVVLAEILAVVA